MLAFQKCIINKQCSITARKAYASEKNNFWWTKPAWYFRVLDIFPHHVNYFIIHAVRCIKAPDEIQVFPFWNVFVVNQVCDLSEQHGNILWVCQPVLSTSPHSSWYSHLLHFVERRSRLRSEKVKTKALEQVSSMVLNCSAIYYTSNCRKNVLDSNFLFCSLTTRDVDRVPTFKKKCNSKESCNTVACTAVKMVSL